MPCGLQVELPETKAWPSCLSWAHEDLIYMGRLFAATPVLGQRSSWSCCSLGMGLSYCSRLAFWFALLTLLPIQTGTARVSSSLSTTHHVHHFHNKHGTVPIAINRMPFLTRGGHGKTFPSNILNLLPHHFTLLIKVRYEHAFGYISATCFNLLVSCVRDNGSYTNSRFAASSVHH